MIKIFFIISLFILLFSCTSYNESKNINMNQTQLSHSKFTNINNDFSYNEYKSFVTEYGKNSKFPEIK
jgi:hypothetical protein|tara:strand:+ start:923 stop:1126 length:204 start_codon:yes stop_codon:yes gene_type:complete